MDGPDQARRTTRGREAHQRGTPPATAKAQGQVPSNNGHGVPQTWEARTTHDEPRHGSRCQAKPGPHTRTSHPQLLGSEPRPHAPRTGGRAWQSARPRTPQTQARGAPARAPSSRPHSVQRGLARSRAVGMVTGPHAHTAPHPQPVGSGPQAHAPRTGSRAWESAQPHTPHTQARGAPPRVPSGRPHSAQNQLARARAVGLATGPHAHTPHTHSQWIAGLGRTPQGWPVGRGGAPNPGRPTPRQEVPPPRRLRAAPTARNASWQDHALWSW